MKNVLLTKATALTAFLFSLLISGVNVQVTTATLSGIVKDAKGSVFAAATVTVEYPDAGITQTLITKGDGRFTVN